LIHKCLSNLKNIQKRSGTQRIKNSQNPSYNGIILWSSRMLQIRIKVSVFRIRSKLRHSSWMITFNKMLQKRLWNPHLIIQEIPRPNLNRYRFQMMYNKEIIRIYIITTIHQRYRLRIRISLVNLGAIVIKEGQMNCLKIR